MSEKAKQQLDDVILGIQYHGSHHNIILSSNNSKIIVKNQQNLNISFNIWNILRTIFLPIGYPHSVKSEYLTYQIYDSIQALCSYLRGVLCTHAILIAAGVGTTEASAMSAAITWIIKDGIGMFYSIFFISTFSTYFGSYLKEWRLFADLINDVALTIDLISPFFPRYMHVYILSLSAICKTMCGISAGSTKLCITNHLCLQSNEADVNAKEGSQETAICLLGLILGMIMSQFASTNSYILFILLTTIHIYCNYYAIKCLQLQSINRTRGYLLFLESQNTTSLHTFLMNKIVRIDNMESFLHQYKSLYLLNESPLAITSINSKDSIFLTLSLCLSITSPIPNILIGVSILDALNNLNSTLFPGQTIEQIWIELQSLFSLKSYCIIPSRSPSGFNVILRRDCPLLDQYEALCRCISLHQKFQNSSLSFPQRYLRTIEEFECYWKSFTTILRYEKWDLDHSISMDCHNWYFEWGTSIEDIKKSE